MRLRPLAVLSTLAMSAMLLAGCGGSSDGSATPKPSSSSSSSKCLVDAKPGAGSDAIKVSGEGLTAKVEVPKGTKFSDIERTIVKKGDGADVHAGDLISIRYQVIQAETNNVTETSQRGVDGVLPLLLDPANAQNPQIIDSTQSPIFIVAAECAPLGSEIVLALPGQEGQGAVVIYMQTLKKLPVTASGKAVEPPTGMAAVKLAKNGEPKISIGDGDKPTATTVGLLKQGDGPEVGSGDLVTVQYMGVTWSDGKSFDSSWSRDAMPSQFATTSVVPGFRKALEGQKVGSQVIVEIPPADGYGDKARGDSIPANSTLVFVVDILATTPPVSAPVG